MPNFWLLTISILKYNHYLWECWFGQRFCPSFQNRTTHFPSICAGTKYRVEGRFENPEVPAVIWWEKSVHSGWDMVNCSAKIWASPGTPKDIRPEIYTRVISLKNWICPIWFWTSKRTSQKLLYHLLTHSV